MKLLNLIFILKFFAQSNINKLFSNSIKFRNMLVRQLDAKIKQEMQ